MGDQQKADKRCRWCVEGESVLKNHKIQTNPIELKKTVVTQNWLKGGGQGNADKGGYEDQPIAYNH